MIDSFSSRLFMRAFPGVLMAIDGKTWCNQIGRQTGISSAAVFITVRRLKEWGLVRSLGRFRVEGIRRSVIMLGLTEKGEKVKRELVGIMRLIEEPRRL